MRTSEERVVELHRRMSVRRENRARRRYAAVSAAAIGACLAAAVLLAVVISRVPIRDPGAAAAATASIFADRMAPGYVVVALLAFCLGALVTVFCFRMRKHREEQRDDRKL